MPVECLPEIGPSAGGVIGMAGRIPITASIVDQQAALYGHGCRRPALAGLALGVELPERAGGDIVYASRDLGRDRWQQRFDQAIGRSRNWR